MSQLTVPKAGVDPGRAATVRVETPTGGADIAKLGNVMADVGVKLENDRLQRQMNRLGVDLTRDMNNLALELSEIGDPDQLESTFQQRTEELRAAYMDGADQNGRPRVDRKNAEAFGLAFDELRNRHELAIGRQALAGRFAQREATFTEFTHEATVAAANSDPEIRQTYLEQGIAQIDQLEANGIIDANEAATRKLGLRANLDNAAAIQDMAQDPEAFLERMDAGEYDGLGGETLARYRVSAEAQIAAAAEKERKAVETATKAEQKLITDQLNEMSGIWSLGQRAAGEDAFLSRPEVQANPAYPEAMAQREIMLEQPSLATMTPAELRALVEEERAKPKVRKFQAERVAVLEKRLAEEETAWSNDPIQHARDLGLADPQLPEFDPADPKAFGAALRNFRAVSEALVDEGYTSTDAVFDKETSEQLKTIIADTSDPAARATLSALVAGSLGDRPDVLKELGVDPAFRMAGELQLAGSSPQVAEGIMRGQRALDQGNVILPPVSDRLDAATDVLDDLFFDVTGGAETQAMIRAAADARYADSFGKTDPSGQLDADAYLQSLHEVMGGSGAWDSSQARGGVQEINGAPTLLPVGVRARDVEQALTHLGSRRAGGVRPTFKISDEALAEDLARISLTGQPPLLGGRPMTEDTFEELSLRAVADGVYEFTFVNDNGQVLVPETPDGEPYRFVLSSLLNGGAK